MRESGPVAERGERAGRALVGRRVPVVDALEAFGVDAENRTTKKECQWGYVIRSSNRTQIDD